MERLSLQGAPRLGQFRFLSLDPGQALVEDPGGDLSRLQSVQQPFAAGRQARLPALQLRLSPRDRFAIHARLLHGPDGDPAKLPLIEEDIQDPLQGGPVRRGQGEPPPRTGILSFLHRPGALIVSVAASLRLLDGIAGAALAADEETGQQIIRGRQPPPRERGGPHGEYLLYPGECLAIENGRPGIGNRDPGLSRFQAFALPVPLSIPDKIPDDGPAVKDPVELRLRKAPARPVAEPLCFQCSADRARVLDFQAREIGSIFQGLGAPGIDPWTKEEHPRILLPSPEFVRWFASRSNTDHPRENTGWAPVGAANDPRHLNEHWPGNVLMACEQQLSGPT